VPGLALSRTGARITETDAPGGDGLNDQAWERLEALPDPRSPRGLMYPLPCLIAAAVCAMTAAGHDRLTAIGQWWLGQASQADLARLRMPRDPWTGIYRAPDEKTIRVVLDRLDPRALTRALLGPRRRRRARRDGSPSTKVRAHRARRTAAQRKALARSRLRGVAVDGKSSRGARRPDGARVHLLGVVEHSGRLLDHLEVDVKHNETTHLTELLAELDLTSVAVTFDALLTVRANLDWLVTTKIRPASPRSLGPPSATAARQTGVNTKDRAEVLDLAHSSPLGVARLLCPPPFSAGMTATFTVGTWNQSLGAAVACLVASVSRSCPR
jgi:hypothetical protein